MMEVKLHPFITYAYSLHVTPCSLVDKYRVSEEAAIFRVDEGSRSRRNVGKCIPRCIQLLLAAVTCRQQLTVAQLPNKQPSLLPADSRPHPVPSRPILLPSRPRSSKLFIPSSFRAAFLYTFLMRVVRADCPAHLSRCVQQLTPTPIKLH